MTRCYKTNSFILVETDTSSFTKKSMAGLTSQPYTQQQEQQQQPSNNEQSSAAISFFEEDDDEYGDAVEKSIKELKQEFGDDFSKSFRSE